jgi:hypothetical protein
LILIKQVSKLLCTGLLLCSAEKKELALHEETRKQNEILDQIHNGLGDLLDGAKVGRDTLFTFPASGVVWMVL